MSRIAAIHHSLCHVDSGSGDIRSLIHIGNAADRTAVHAHPKLYPRVFLESATNFDRALRGRFRTGVKYQRHPVTRRDFKQTVRGFGSLKLLGRANKLVSFVNRRVLVVNRKFRVAYNVDEQDMGDLELNLLFNLSGHLAILRELNNSIL